MFLEWIYDIRKSQLVQELHAILQLMTTINGKIVRPYNKVFKFIYILNNYIIIMVGRKKGVLEKILGVNHFMGRFRMTLHVSVLMNMNRTGSNPT